MLTVSKPDADSGCVAVQPVVGNIVRGVSKLLLLVAILWCLQQAMPEVDTLSIAWRQWLSWDPMFALLLFLLGGMLFVAVGLPRQTLALVGGYAYGPLIGAALALLVTVAGSALTYVVARRLGRPRLQSRFPSQMARFDGWTADHAFAKVLALRLFPVGSNLVTNIGAGIAQVRPGAFLQASVLGFVPQTVVFALSGTAVEKSSTPYMIVAIAMLIVSIVIGGYVYKASRSL